MMAIVFAAATWVVIAWTWTAVLMTWIRLLWPLTKMPVLRTLFCELRPFFLPSACLMLVYATIHHESLFWRSFTFACNVVNWFFYKDRFDDDDRWKRRKAKLAETVRAVGG